MDLAPAVKRLTLRLEQAAERARTAANAEQMTRVELMAQNIAIEIRDLFKALRLTLYTVDAEKTLVARIMTAQASIREMRLPIGPQSLPGHAAQSRMLLNIPDMHDLATLRRAHPQLMPSAFAPETDARAGHRSRQMLLVPLLDGEQLCGVLQLVNRQGEEPFGAQDIQNAKQLAPVLAAALRVYLQRVQTAGAGSGGQSASEIVAYANRLIMDAHAQKASDIHIEPLPGDAAQSRIRLRIDGLLAPYGDGPVPFREALAARLKIMGDLDIAERRKPQDGKIQFGKFGALDLELRIATMPTAQGLEDVVLRLLTSGEPLPLAQLGLTPHNRARLEQVLGKPHGLFYVCGPTGSGKTTTLHSILKLLNRPETKIWTAEDPVEITQAGMRQVQVNKKAGLDFALIMRALLRADPDIIMVGESRDRETVAMSVEASLTGHLVFSTLHTNSAPESITRLLDLGMDPFNFSDALLGVLAQRLARKLCACKQAYAPTEAEMDAFITEYTQPLRSTKAWQKDAAGVARVLREQWLRSWGQEGRGQDGQFKLYRPAGCPQCKNSGYSGRIGLHELLVADAAIKRLVQTRAPVSEITAAAIEGGMRTLKMDGMEKVLQGWTDLRQVRQVCVD